MIYATALTMLEKVSIPEGIRLLGISLSHMSQGGAQLSLFEECSGKREKVTSVVDELKNRFGENIVKKGGYYK
jgi:DNA polymerase-4